MVQNESLHLELGAILQLLKCRKTGRWLRNMSVCTARKNMRHKVHGQRHISCDT
ncbi:hypothetical protein Hanom_Chr11g00980341 [Helianthus anomalus]